METLKLMFSLLDIGRENVSALSIKMVDSHTFLRYSIPCLSIQRRREKYPDDRILG